MYKKIFIDGKEIELLANAATPFRFKQVFRKDLLKLLGEEEGIGSEAIETVTRLCFIMNRQAKKADMSKLNEEEFITWLEDFGSMSFVTASEDILNVYMDSADSKATP